MKRLLVMFTVFALVLTLGMTVFAKGKPAPDPTDPANKVFTTGRFGEYCSDPIPWLQQGARVGIWPTNVPFRAQAVDANGYKVSGIFDYSVALTGETGTMALVDANDLVYQKAPYVPEGIHYDYTVTVDGVTGSGTLNRDPAQCENCHSSPPGHIADPATWGKCRTCHDLGEVMMTKAYVKAGLTDQCYSCHPTGCWDTDLHKTQFNMWCTDCHGDLSQTIDGTFKISSMAGKPLCADCHDRLHKEPTKGVLFAESTRHGGMLCISCHDAPHRVVKPTNLGDGVNNNCSGCHTTQPNDPKMGPNCGECHKSSWDPHLVTRAK